MWTKGNTKSFQHPSSAFHHFFSECQKNGRLSDPVDGGISRTRHPWTFFLSRACVRGSPWLIAVVQCIQYVRGPHHRFGILFIADALHDGWLKRAQPVHSSSGHLCICFNAWQHPHGLDYLPGKEYNTLWMFSKWTSFSSNSIPTEKSFVAILACCVPSSWHCRSCFAAASSLGCTPFDPRYILTVGQTQDIRLRFRPV